MKENLDICYTWSIRNRNIRNFAFRQNYSTRFTEPREDYFFISSCLQEFLNNTNLLPALSADDSRLQISLLSDKSHENGNRFWKFHNYLVYDVVYFENMKKYHYKNNNSKKFMEKAQTKSKFLKYEFQKFIIDYPKTIPNKRNKQDQFRTRTKKS